MKKLGYTKQFKKDLRKAIKSGRDKTKLDEVILKLRNGSTLEANYEDHQLTGNWKCHRECHIAPDWLLIYQRFPSEIVLVRNGTHSSLF